MTLFLQIIGGVFIAVVLFVIAVVFVKYLVIPYATSQTSRASRENAFYKPQNKASQSCRKMLFKEVHINKTHSKLDDSIL